MAYRPEGSQRYLVSGEISFATCRSSRGLSEKFECLTDLDSTSTTYPPYSLWEWVYALGRDVPPNAEGYKGRLLLGYLLKNDTSGNEHLFRGSLYFCFASS